MFCLSVWRVFVQGPHKPGHARCKSEHIEVVLFFHITVFALEGRRSETDVVRMIAVNT